jgi:large subunit ribosomal protein L4
LNQVVFLEELIFNQPIRKDIIHRVYQWSIMWDKKTTHRGFRVWMKSGSRKKLAPQKGRGKARVGFKRAAGRVGGAKAFAHVPKDFRFFLPEKVKIQGLKSMLSAKLAEGKLVYLFKKKREN